MPSAIDVISDYLGRSTKCSIATTATTIQMAEAPATTYPRPRAVPCSASSSCALPDCGFVTPEVENRHAIKRRSKGPCLVWAIRLIHKPRASVFPVARSRGHSVYELRTNSAPISKSNQPWHRDQSSVRDATTPGDRNAPWRCTSTGAVQRLSFSWLARIQCWQNPRVETKKTRVSRGAGFSG